MINSQDLVFSIKLSQQRIAQSEIVLGNSSLIRIICFALYNLGVNRKNLSTVLSIPIGTVKSIIRAINQGGATAFNDRRKKHPTIDVLPLPPKQKTIVDVNDKTTIITIGHTEIKISNNNPLQKKVFILTLLNNGIINNAEVAAIFNISKAHVTNLSKGIRDNDVLSLIDKRKGQQKDYVFNENIKSELIQQFVANTITGDSTSSNSIASQINTACNTHISDRAVRQHISKLGLNKIKSSLPELLNDSKKNSKE